MDFDLQRALLEFYSMKFYIIMIIQNVTGSYPHVKFLNFKLIYLQMYSLNFYNLDIYKRSG